MLAEHRLIIQCLIQNYALSPSYRLLFYNAKKIIYRDLVYRT